MSKNNYFLGIDVGSTKCKAIAINEHQKIMAKAQRPVKGDPEKAAKECVKQIAKDLNNSKRKLKKNAIATGQNGDKISIKEKASEIIALGKGCYALAPDVRIIVDVGSFSMKAIKIDKTGKIKDYLLNDKCASGAGVLLDLVSEGLELDVEELSNVAFQAKNPIKISSQCSIFAESEVISYKNEGADIPDLIAGVCNSVAGRIYPLIRKLDKDPQTVSFTGGVAKCQKVVENLEERLELKLTKLPIEPEYLPAYGAAVIAMNGGEN